MEFSARANSCSVPIHPDRLAVSPLLCMALFVDEKFGPDSVVRACSLGTPILAEELTAIEHG